MCQGAKLIPNGNKHKNCIINYFFSNDNFKVIQTKYNMYDFSSEIRITTQMKNPLISMYQTDIQTNMN